MLFPSFFPRKMGISAKFRCLETMFNSRTSRTTYPKIIEINISNNPRMFGISRCTHTSPIDCIFILLLAILTDCILISFLTLFLKNRCIFTYTLEINVARYAFLFYSAANFWRWDFINNIINGKSEAAWQIHQFYS
jgi:hypothetical protein